MRRRTWSHRLLIAVALGLVSATWPAATASAAPARVLSVERVNDRQEIVQVYSPSMNRPIKVEVIRAPNRASGRPTLYLLNGAGGGEDRATWTAQTDALSFFRDKPVNVVTPVGGRFSYYTDWIRDDPVLGRNKWQTFLNSELPPVIERHLGASNRRALAAISMTGTSVLNLAIAKPGLWNGVAAYSGCAQTSDPLGHQFVQTVVETWGGAQSVQNMWGPPNDPLWRANDPLLNAAKLRGTAIYLSTGNGIPAAPNDTLANPRVQDGRADLPAQLVLGTSIEAATHYCTVNMANRLQQLSIPATLDIRANGTHSWGYWQDDLHRSWPFLARTLGA